MHRPPAPPLVADDHHPLRLLKDAIPPWLGLASASKHAALKQATPVQTQAPAEQRAQLHQLNGAHWQAQNQVDDALKDLQDAKAFAKPILEDALLRRFSLDLDSDAVHIRLYLAQTVPWFALPSGAARTWTVSLLDAALHNFDYHEAQDDAHEPDSTFISRPSDTGQFDTLPAIRQVLSITAFIRLCRELDIGARYARYLNEALGMHEPVASAVLQHKVNLSQKAALRAALQLASLQGDIQDDWREQIEALLDDAPPVTLDPSPLRCHDLSMLEAPLTGPLLFAPDLYAARTVQPVVVYLPDDPQHPVKQYASTLAFKQELVRQLRNDDYQQFFSRFVDHAQRGLFFSRLSDRLATLTWHTPQPGSGLAPWRDEPVEDPQLQLAFTPITGNPWQHLYQRTLDKLLNDARTLAVPTADADSKARWALWDSFVDVASSILNVVLQVAAPFIPGLGELMMGYMAYQLLDEVFEGIVDWAEGEGREALGHLLGVTQSLVQLGAFAAAGSIGVTELRKALPTEVIAFIDRFKPVKLANGTTRYWKPDLKPYQKTFTLPPGLRPNEQGLHPIRGESILPLGDTLYAVEKDTGSDHYRIKHPTRPHAYQPLVRHNGTGAWHTELERPLQWDRATLLQRLGYKVHSLSAADRELALHISGVHENTLRKMHVNGEAVPPLLSDVLARLGIDRELQQLIEHLRSDDPAVYHAIDPQDQLQLLTAYGYWPATKTLQLLDEQGHVSWTFGDPNQPTVRIHENQLDNGDFLKTVLRTLSPEEITRQFGERASDPQLSLEARARNLRKALADIAEKNRAALFDSRYGPLQFSGQPRTHQVMKTTPGLPASIAGHLVDHASGAELAELDQRRTPARLSTLAQTVLDELRVNRAYEGQHLSAIQSLDTDRLVLKSLPRQPGWSAQIRLDARHLSPDGQVWCRVGADDAKVQRSLVRTQNGRYVAYDGSRALSGETDLYSAIVQALPDAEREALHIDIHQGPQLRKRVAQRPMEREPLRALLGGDPPTPHTVEALRMLGNNGGYPPAAAQVASLPERARALFPQFDDGEINTLVTYLQSQPGGAEQRITHLEQEFAQLQIDLHAWRGAVPATHPTTGLELTPRQRLYELQNRRHLAQQIRECWQRESSVDDYYEDPARDGLMLRLQYPIVGELPALSCDFSHVTLLSLLGNDGTRGVTAFVQRFPNVRHLEVRDAPIGDLPTGIQTLANLNHLSLDNCSITLTPESHARLASMQGLRTLNLHQNPLGVTPSVEAMHDLTDLDLSETGIERLPPGLLNRPELETAFLGDNRIRELPAAMFQLSPVASQRFDLSGNPLSRATLEQVKAYFQRHGVHWEVDALPIDQQDTRRLFPLMNNNDINTFIFSLPGDIESGKIELARLAGELQTLRQELTQWSQDASIEPLESARRKALHQLLERSWRRETQQTTPFVHVLNIARPLMGELPTLSARFNHIGYLVLEGHGGPLQPGPFIESFPALTILNMQNVQLGDIPTSILELPALTHLSLSRCSITLSARSQAALSGMHRLQYLNLDHSPLERAPDFRQMPAMSYVSLQDTGLRQVPEGLLTQQRSMTVNLAYNAIQTLPEASFTLPARVTHDFFVSHNPLSMATLEQIKTYCQLTGEFFNADPPAGLRERAQHLYPSLLEVEADQFIFKLPGTMADIDPHLTRLEAEYEQLGTDLEQWVLDVPERHPVLDIPLDDSTRAEEQLQRRNVRTLLEQAWRRESPEDEENLEDELTHSVHLDTPVMGDLPALSVHFAHVSRLELTGNGTTTGLDGTLRGFPNLQSLSVTRCSLQSLPGSLFNMPKLVSLELSHCALRLSSESALAVADLQSLEFLDLSNNPLTHAPDVRPLNQLVALHLRSAQLSEVPTGVFRLGEMQTLDLSDNQIREIPADILEMIPTFHDDSDLSDNPLSAQSLGYLRTYYQRTGTDFQVPEAIWDEHGHPLETPLQRPQEE
ncbi:dermonecrotic toxin domain-containing protein [Pseudomonas sp. SDO528_S397]